MHLVGSKTVGPSGRRSSAVVGQAETHAGSMQCRQRRITKSVRRPPGDSGASCSWNEIKVSVLALSTAGFW